MIFRIYVEGIPAPQGSKVRTRYGMREASQAVGPWREAVKAVIARTDAPRMTGPVRVEYEFRFTRPASHYGTGKNAGRLKPSAPAWCTSRKHGDLDKLQRSTNDALTDSGVITDDSMIVQAFARRVYARPGEVVGATIIIREMKDDQ